MKKIAIIGAGFTGAYLASKLKDSYQVTVFEKARGVGGRMSTRYTDDYEFDHGVPYFKASNPDFLSYLQDLEHKNVIASYLSADQYLSLPRMNQLVKYLLKGIELNCGVKIEKLEHQQQLWHLYDEHHQLLGSFDWVISTAPAQQTEILFSKKVSFYDKLSELYLKPQLVLMLGLTHAISDLDKVIKIDDAVIEMLVNNSKKPGRPEGVSWLVYADKNWSEMHLEDDLKPLEEKLLSHTLKYLPITQDEIVYQSLHRWRYAQSSHHLEQPLVLIDSHLQCGACGDWCFNGDVESAYLAARALLQTMSYA